MPNPILSKPSRRQLTLVDIMILVAAIGLGFDGSRWFVAGIPFPYIPPHYDFCLFQALMMATPVASTLTLALIVVPVRHFRSRLRRLPLFPGMTACGLAALVLLLIAIHWAILWYEFRIGGATAWTYYGLFTFDCLRFCGIGVVAALIVVLAGYRRFRRDPIDWLRLAMAVYWVAIFLVVGSI